MSGPEGRQSVVKYPECVLPGVSYRVNPDQLAEYVRKLSNTPQPNEYQSSLYVNSSDSLRNLARLQGLSGAKVLSIAGSGDFPLMFAFQGASKVCVFDVSPFACALTELKVVAAQVLDLAGFWALIGTIYGGKDQRHPILNWSILKELEPYLTPTTRRVFEVIQERPDGPYASVLRNEGSFPSRHGSGRSAGSLDEYNSVTRFRGTRIGSSLSEIKRYPFLASDKAYEELQDRLRFCKFKIMRGRLDLESAEYSTRFDLVYLSNALDLASCGQFFARGARRVVATFSYGDAVYQEDLVLKAARAVAPGASISVSHDPHFYYGIQVDFQSEDFDIGGRGLADNGAPNGQVMRPRFLSEIR